jgi:hypothetical protein
LDERDNAIARVGFTTSEEIACFVVPVPAAGAAPPAGAVPLYRLYLESESDHLYTTSEVERETAINEGWTYDLEACYVYPTQQDGTQPLYRLYNPGSKKHFYTTSETERQNAINNLGFKDDGDPNCYFVFTADPSGVTPFYRLAR